MRRIHSSTFALVFAASTSAWAGGGPYPVDTGYERGPSKSRAQVIAELREAQRLGLISAGEGDFPKINANQEAGDMVVVWGDSRLARAKIHAETVEAARLGLLSFGEGDPPVATAEQEKLIAAAGSDAVQSAQRTVEAAAR